MPGLMGHLFTFDGVCMLLAAYKIRSYCNTPTVTLLARDSIVYFTIILACTVVDLIADRDIHFPITVSFATQCITSIAVGRMMMNIRGLILNDPEYTVHLQALQFAVPEAGPEIEEVARSK